jgi:hypothetical protein
MIVYAFYSRVLNPLINLIASNLFLNIESFFNIFLSKLMKLLTQKNQIQPDLLKVYVKIFLTMWQFFSFF